MFVNIYLFRLTHFSSLFTLHGCVRAPVNSRHRSALVDDKVNLVEVKYFFQEKLPRSTPSRESSVDVILKINLINFLTFDAWQFRARFPSFSFFSLFCSRPLSASAASYIDESKAHFASLTRYTHTLMAVECSAALLRWRNLSFFIISKMKFMLSVSSSARSFTFKSHPLVW